MEIKDFIEKAIAGGWNHRIQNATIQRVDADDHSFHVHFWDNEGNQSDMFSYSLHALLLDPLAWQAVGKVEGWPTGFPDPKNQYSRGMSWKINMYRMIDHLAEGGTIESYLKTL